MSPLDKRRLATHIRQVLWREKFRIWYTTGNFDKWVSDGTHTPEFNEQLLEDIENLFLDNVTINVTVSV